jgi:penicillin amidase
MRPDALRRGATTALVVFLLLAGLTVSATFFQVRRSVQSLGGSVRFAALDSMVTVYFDRHSIPHLFGSTRADAFRAQGYIHANERLWQMELFQRTARGQLAELFGEPALMTDRFLRTLDLWGVAESSLRALPASDRRLLEAYAEGVNERIATWTGPWPPEFLLLGIQPTPWEPASSLAIAKLMALDLAEWRTEISRMLASQRLDAARYAYLELPYPDWGPTIVPDGSWLPAAMPDATTAQAATAAQAVSTTATTRSAPPESTGGPGPVSGAGAGWDPFEFLSGFGLNASNSWAVAGIRTKSRQPLLASDMHLSLRAPATWYVNAVHGDAEGYHVAGLSIPGAPGVVVGYNRDIAWAFTNGMVDDTDLAVEEASADGRTYRQGNGWRPFAVRFDTIRVRGLDEPVVHRVRETVRGPVISDVLSGVESTLSLLWTAWLPTTEVSGLLAMNGAEDPNEFERAVRQFELPHQNVVYITTHGVLGYRLSGTIPQRDGWTGRRPVPATRVPDAWTGFWPPDSFPSMQAPASGYLATANNLQRRDLFGRVGSEYPVPFRARRIEDRLAEQMAWDVDLMRDLQLDAAADRAGAADVAGSLRAWDYDVSIVSTEATVFHIWLYRLRELIAADEFDEFDGWEYFPTSALLKVLEDGGGPWVDDVRTDHVEALEELETAAMRVALQWQGLAWGAIHRETSVHPMGRVGWLERLFGFNVGPYPGPGGPGTVRPGSGSWAALDSTAWLPPIVGAYGPSERFVAEMAPGASLGRFLLPTGQSGNPLSSHYRDMLTRWAAGDLIPVPLYRDDARDLAVRTLQLLAR